MNKRFISSTLILLLASLFCYATGYTLAVANSIIVALVVIVIALIAMGGYIIHNNRLIHQRNEQLRRILTALDDYRAMVADGVLSLDEQEEMLKNKLSKPKKAKAVQKGEEHSFFVKMDARVNKERPFADPDFDQAALAAFMDVTTEAFCQLVPRYADPARTLDYINSLRAECAAKILMEHPDYSTDDIAGQCGFRDTAAFNKAFRFSFGITPTDYLSDMKRMFKNN